MGLVRFVQNSGLLIINKIPTHKNYYELPASNASSKKQRVAESAVMRTEAQMLQNRSSTMSKL